MKFLVLVVQNIGSTVQYNVTQNISHFLKRFTQLSGKAGMQLVLGHFCAVFKDNVDLCHGF